MGQIKEMENLAFWYLFVLNVKYECKIQDFVEQTKVMLEYNHISTQNYK